MNAAELTAALGGAWHGADGMARCPAHEDATPSLAIKQGKHGVVVYCHAGCEQAAVIDALRGKGLWGRDTRPDPFHGSRAPARSAPDDRSAKSARARAIWREAKPIAGTLAERYLRSRGISIPLPLTLRFHPALWHRPTASYRPALVAGVQSPDGPVIAVHRIYFARDGSREKLAFGPLGAGAIRLAPAGEALGIAEGLETALSAMQIHGIPVWASISAGRMHRVALPPEVRRVVILADNDGPGLQAANNALEVYSGQRRRVEIRVPPLKGRDWNDVLRAGEIVA